jgi:outer membrane protein OmpA-like peptidoglycan-associated protein
LNDPEEKSISGRDLIELQKLLLGHHIERVEELRQRLDDTGLRSQETSKILVEALALCVRQDRRVQSVLQPVVEESLRIWVEREPALLATALFPIVGRAVRKSVANSLQQLLDSLNSILAEGFSIKRWRWRIEALRSGKTLGEIVLARSLAYRVEQVYLIHRRTGILLAESSRQAGVLEDPDLVVGMLTALQDFVRDSFTIGKQDDLEILHIGEFKVWIQHGPLALLAVVIQGQPPQQLRVLFAEKIELVHKDFHTDLASFETTGRPIPGIGSGLDDCLLGAGRAEAPPYTRFKVATAIVAALAFIVLFVQVRDAVRWRNYVEDLRREPGIVVIEAHRGLSTFSLVGLRDPIALQPVSLLPKFHLSEKKVSEHWEEYLSLDPRLAMKRRLESEADSLRKAIVRFELDSIRIPLDQFPVVDAVSDQIHQLSLDAATQGKELKVNIYGHTDHTGAESHNAKLSQQRADEMVRLLRARGIDESILSAEGLGDKQPRRAGADLYEQSMDRRVTFMVAPDQKKY